MSLNDKNQAKSRVLEHKGDQLAQKGKLEKAIQCYEQALELDLKRVELYDKLLSLHEKLIDHWEEEDFAYNLELTMRKQEILDPAYKRIHARLNPEFKNTIDKIKLMLSASSSEIETRYVEEIVGLGNQALYPLIDFLLSFKEIGKRKKK